MKQPILHAALPLLFVILFAAAPARAQRSDTIRVATFNLVVFPRQVPPETHRSVRNVIEAMDADVLLLQMVNTRNRGAFVADSLLATIPNRRLTVQPVGDGAFYADLLLVDTAKVTATGSGKQIGRTYVQFWTLIVRATGDTIRLVGGIMNSGFRLRESIADTLALARSAGRTDTSWIFAGTVPMSGSEDTVYRSFTGAELPGPAFVDPAGVGGEWDDNPELAWLHNSSPKEGLRRRESFIMMTSELLPRVVPGSLQAFGNEGILGDTVSLPPHSFLPDSVAISFGAFNQLPVMIDLVFGAQPSAAVTERADERGSVTVVPTPARDRAELRFDLAAPATVELRVHDTRGRLVHRGIADLDAGSRRLDLSTAELPTGVYVWELRRGSTVSRGRLAVVR